MAEFSLLASSHFQPSCLVLVFWRVSEKESDRERQREIISGRSREKGWSGREEKLLYSEINWIQNENKRRGEDEKETYPEMERRN